MDHASWWVMDIIGPSVLLIVLIWLVIRKRPRDKPSDQERTDRGTFELYREEEQRRLDRTDQL